MTAVFQSTSPWSSSLSRMGDTITIWWRAANLTEINQVNILKALRISIQSALALLSYLVWATGSTSGIWQRTANLTEINHNNINFVDVHYAEKILSSMGDNINISGELVNLMVVNQINLMLVPGKSSVTELHHSYAAPFGTKN
jgi:hypothetical protein